MNLQAIATLKTSPSARPTSQRVREPWIDWVRVAGAIGIIALHVTAREKVRRAGQLEGFEWWTLASYETITRAAVPLFFMISGYLIIHRCENGRSEHYAWRRMGRILAVAICWTLAFSAWEMFKGNNDSIFGFVTNALFSKPYYHLWFLYAIAGTYFASPLLAPGLSAIKERFGILLGWGLPIAVSIDFVLSQFQAQTNYYRTSIFSICIPYLAYTCAGYLLKRDGRQRNPAYSAVAYLAGVGACLAAFWYFSSISLADADRKVFFPLSPCVVIMSLGAYSIISDRRLFHFSPLPSLANRFAQDSMGIFILHPFALDIVNHFGLVGRRPNALIGIALTTVVVTAMTWIVVIVFKRFALTRSTLTV